MPVTLKVYTDEDDALLFWSIASPVAACRGFAIRRRKHTGQSAVEETWLPNRIGFADEPAPADPKEGQDAVTKPSTEWPFQRFSWTDHDANTGDTVSYRVVPVVRGSDGTLTTLDAETSAWSPDRTLGTNTTATFRAFFNRGFVMSQFMARYLSERKLTLAQFKKTISDKDDKTIRLFLSGDLRLELLTQLTTAQQEGTDIYAALFELADDELIAALCALGSRAHVVLSNGSITKGTTETTAQARLRDENADSRQTLVNAHVDVEEDHRFIAPGPLGHNKFLVRMGKDGKPAVAWTGSTNWTPTGLCTQVNNGLLVNDKNIAQLYLDQWHRLRDAGNSFPDTLVDANGQPKPVGADTAGTVRSVLWFSRTRKGVDMDALRAEVQKAKVGILFLMFMPGSTGLFSTVAARSGEPNLYVRGVVSELPTGTGDPSTANVSVIAGADHTSLHLDIIQPEGIQQPFAHFAEEVTRKQFLANIGYAIIHSKVVVVDPFTADPTVITGSHNFSTNASTQNDENFIVIKGDRALAEAYAVNIMGAYEHYRWRAYLAQTNTPFNGLEDDDTWQAPMLLAHKSELTFWGV